MPDAKAATLSRRDELLAIAAELFATKGFRNTTVRDIADAAGILSGSLYHHFDSKEAMVDEILSTFQGQLLERWETIQRSDMEPRQKVEAVLRSSFAAIDEYHNEVAIFQNDATYLATLDGFDYLEEHRSRLRGVWLSLVTEGIDAGVLEPDLDPELTYRFVRDTVWLAVRWYKPGGKLKHTAIADHYVQMLFNGIARRRDDASA